MGSTWSNSSLFLVWPKIRYMNYLIIGFMVLLIIVMVLVIGWVLVLIIGGDADNDKKKWM